MCNPNKKRFLILKKIYIRKILKYIFFDIFCSRHENTLDTRYHTYSYRSASKLFPSMIHFSIQSIFYGSNGWNFMQTKQVYKSKRNCLTRSLYHKYASWDLNWLDFSYDLIFLCSVVRIGTLQCKLLCLCLLKFHVYTCLLYHRGLFIDSFCSLRPVWIYFCGAPSMEIVEYVE